MLDGLPSVERRPSWEGLWLVCATGVVGGIFAVGAAGGSDRIMAWLWPFLPVSTAIGEYRRSRRRIN